MYLLQTQETPFSTFNISDILILLLGAAVGFGAERIKIILDRRTFKNQLLAELKANLSMLPLFKKYVADTIKAMQAGGAPNMRTIHFSTACYETYFPSVLQILSTREQISFHFVYDSLRICNETSDEISTVVFSVNEKQEFNRQLRLYSGKLESILDIITQTETNIRDHLAGNPRDFLGT